MTERQELKEFWKDKDLNMVFSTTSLLYRTCPLTYLTDLFEVCKTNIGWDPDTTLKPYLLGARGGWGQQQQIEDPEVKKSTCRGLKWGWDIVIDCLERLRWCASDSSGRIYIGFLRECDNGDVCTP